MGTSVNTFTNSTGTLQPFIGSGGGKFIDNFSSSDLVSGYTDPYQGIAFRKINTIQMDLGGTGTGTMGIWASAGVRFDTATTTLNGVTATVSSAQTSETVTIDAVIASGVTYYAGAHGSTSLCAERDNATGSFSSYSGSSTTSTTVSTTYNPGNLAFVLKYYYLPNAPTAVTVTSKTSTSATISWTASSDPGGYATNTLRYKIKWTNASGGLNDYALIESAANASSATITGLVPGETYQFQVAAMNGIIPATGSSYSSLDDSVYIDEYSSGPWSTASTASQLPGGIYNGSVWKRLNTTKVKSVNATAFVSGSVGTLSNLAEITLQTATNPFIVGDYIEIAGTTGLSGFNGFWTVSSVGGSANNWQVYFTQGYFNSNPSVDATLTTQGTATGYKPVTIKAYNGTWQTFY
jgi:hypothetical protein